MKQTENFYRGFQVAYKNEKHNAITYVFHVQFKMNYDEHLSISAVIQRLSYSTSVFAS